MSALGVANMILHGDGKTNLYQGLCFDPRIVKQLKEVSPAMHIFALAVG